MHTTRVTVGAACVALLAFGLTTTSAQAEATKQVSFDGVTATVPTSWPVVDVDGEPGCVSYAVHAVYLGTPSESTCPAGLSGHTETLQLYAATGAPASTAPDRTVTHQGSTVVAVVTSGAEPATATKVATSLTWPKQPSLAHGSARTEVTSPKVVAPSRVGGGNFHGLGFDACSAPSLAAMTAWKRSSPYDAANIYIGGADRACSQANLTSSWITSVANLGWKLIPTFVGLQAPCTSFSSFSAANAAAKGKAAADNAAAIMTGLGMGAGLGNPVYYDMEAYTRGGSCSAAVKVFTNAWTTELHAKGYLSGIYGSVSSMTTDLVSWSSDPAYADPDDIWFARWGSPSSPAHDDAIPDTLWVKHRIHQYKGGHDETYGGVTINIDNDAHNGDAANGADVTPPVAHLATLPTFDLSTTVNLRWSGTDVGSGVASYDVRRTDTTGATHTWTVPAGWGGTTATSATMTGARGHSYCFQTRAHDRAGNVGGWSAITCTALPYDDHALAITKAWKRITGTTFYAGTATTTTTQGATARRNKVLLDRVGLLATRCPTCGTVGVYVGSKLVGTVNLAGPAQRQYLAVLPKIKRQTATVTYKVLSRGRAVQVDGLVVSND